MLAANLNPFVEDGRISLNSLVYLRKFTCSLVKERKILIVLDIVPEKIVSLNSKIGNPINIEELVAGKTNPASSGAQNTVLPSPSFSPSPSHSASGGPCAVASESHVFGSASLVSSDPPSSNMPFSTMESPASSSSIPPLLTPKSKAPSLIPNGVSYGSLDASSDYTPIASLSPYNNRWTIKARCISKQDIRVFTNARGQGKVFSLTLMDASGEIRATAFNDAVTQFFPLFEVGRVYSISKGQVKIAKRGFGAASTSAASAANANPYDLTLEKDTVIKPLLGTEAASVPAPTYSIVPISKIAEYPKDAIVDVIGIVLDVHPCSTIVAKSTGKQITRRDLVLVDASNASIRATLWGKQAEEAEGSDWRSEPVLAIKGAKVSDWSGRTLSLVSSSQILLQPTDIEEALTLRGWYDSVGASIARTAAIRNLSAGSGLGDDNSQSISAASGSSFSTSIGERRTLSQFMREEPQFHEKAEYTDIVATITFIKFDGMVAYAACPGLSEGNVQCQKKVIEVGPSLFRCEKCQRTYDTCNYRYVLSIHVADHTGQSWVNAFNEAGEQLLGLPASDLVKMRESDLAAFDRVFKKANFSTWRFKLRAKQETYQGEMKMRLSVISINPVPLIQESNMLLDHILAIK
ncbi:single-stranded DNA binding [Mitosporidium daphniae]